MTLRLFWHVLTMQARKQMSYRADFWINAIVGFVVVIGVIYYLWIAIYREAGVEVIGGFTFAQIVYYYIAITLLGKIIRGSEFGTGTMAEEVYDGSLTRYLVYPVRYFPFKYAQHLGELVPAIVQLLVFGTGCLLVLEMPEGAGFSARAVLMTIVSVMAANILHYVMYIPFEGVAFWQDNVWSLRVMVRFGLGFLGGQMIPLSLLPEWAQRLLAALPFRYVYSDPVNALMGKLEPAEWFRGIVIALLWAGGMMLIARVVWKRGFHEYTGVGI